MALVSLGVQWVPSAPERGRCRAVVCSRCQRVAWEDKSLKDAGWTDEWWDETRYVPVDWLFGERPAIDS
jgi:hypothetical protein